MFVKLDQFVYQMLLPLFGTDILWDKNKDPSGSRRTMLLWESGGGGGGGLVNNFLGDFI